MSGDSFLRYYILYASRIGMSSLSSRVSKKEVKLMISSSLYFSVHSFNSSTVCLSFLSEAVSFSLVSRSVILHARIGLLKLGESLSAVGDLLGVLVAEVDMLDGARVVYVGTAKSETWLIKGSTWD